MDRPEPPRDTYQPGGSKGKAKLKVRSKKGKADFLPPVIPTVSPRFDVNDPAAMAFLDENGYAVFKDVANQEEIEKGIGLAWDFLESVAPGVSRTKVDTWDSPGWPNPFGNGIVVANSVGHCPLVWFVRGIANVQTIYKKIWNTEDVITSYDGFCVHRPWEYNENWKTKDGTWFHLDQNGITKPDKLCVQGFLNFYPAGEEDGGLVVVPKSHTIFPNIFAKRPYLKDRGDWVPMFSDKTFWEIEFKQAKLSAIKVCCQPGDFVVWDSRTVHCNCPATAPRKLPTDGTLLPLRRLVTYVCMTPTSRLNHKQRALRIQYFKEGMTTSHWPEDCFAQKARRKTDQDYVPVMLNDNQKKLIPMPDTEK